MIRHLKRFKTECIQFIDDLTGEITDIEDKVNKPTEIRYKCPLCDQYTFFKPGIGMWTCEKCGKQVLLSEIKREGETDG